eukprot:365243-Chlamydomonas_euryale.AAC.19
MECLWQRTRICSSHCQPKLTGAACSTALPGLVPQHSATRRAHSFSLYALPQHGARSTSSRATPPAAGRSCVRRPGAAGSDVRRDALPETSAHAPELAHPARAPGVGALGREGNGKDGPGGMQRRPRPLRAAPFGTPARNTMAQPSCRRRGAPLADGRRKRRAFSPQPEQLLGTGLAVQLLLLARLPLTSP